MTEFKKVGKNFFEREVVLKRHKPKHLRILALKTKHEEKDSRSNKNILRLFKGQSFKDVINESEPKKTTIDTK